METVTDDIAKIGGMPVTVTPMMDIAVTVVPTEDVENIAAIAKKNG